jgi:hypothetical protein
MLTLAIKGEGENEEGGARGGGREGKGRGREEGFVPHFPTQSYAPGGEPLGASVPVPFCLRLEHCPQLISWTSTDKIYGITKC